MIVWTWTPIMGCQLLKKHFFRWWPRFQIYQSTRKVYDNTWKKNNPAQSYGLFDAYVAHIIFFKYHSCIKRRNLSFEKRTLTHLHKSNYFIYTPFTVIIFKTCLEVNIKTPTCNNCWYNIVFRRAVLRFALLWSRLFV